MGELLSFNKESVVALHEQGHASINIFESLVEAGPMSAVHVSQKHVASVIMIQHSLAFAPNLFFLKNLRNIRRIVR